MEMNVGSIERIIRVSLGIGLLSFVYFLTINSAGWAWSESSRW